jgi:hypothetical protein
LFYFEETHLWHVSLQGSCIDGKVYAGFLQKIIILSNKQNNMAVLGIQIKKINQNIGTSIETREGNHRNLICQVSYKKKCMVFCGCSWESGKDIKLCVKRKGYTQ